MLEENFFYSLYFGSSEGSSFLDSYQNKAIAQVIRKTLFNNTFTNYRKVVTNKKVHDVLYKTIQFLIISISLTN